MRLALFLPLALTACFYVTAEQRADRADLDDDGVAWTDDCDPDDPAVGAVFWYADTDGDGFGDKADRVRDCDQPEGYVADDTDCDDTAPLVFPGAPELCNAADDNCNSEVDEDVVPQDWYQDSDGDGQGNPDEVLSDCAQPDGYVPNADDCDDGNEAIKLGGTEVCDGNGVDEDCDGDADLDDSDIDPADHTWFLDGDGDGWGVDDGLTNAITCGTPPSGYVDQAGDCDDGNAAVNPDAEEVCDGVDNDCANGTDGPTATDATTFYADVDGDGQGDINTSIVDCSAPDAYWATGVPTDCDDTDPCTYLGAVEVCNGEDTDCDGTPDDNCTAIDTGDTGGGACY